MKNSFMRITALVLAILQHFLYVLYRLRVVQLDHFTNQLVTPRIPFLFFHVLHLLYLLYHTLGVYTIYFT